VAVDCTNCPLRKHDIFAPMTDADVQAMEKFKVGELTVDPGTTLLIEGSNSPQLYTALRGMGLRYKLLPDGSRQVVNLIFPGDFIGLQAGLMGEMEHSVEATSKMTLCVFERRALWQFFQQHPERGFALTWLAAVEEHFLGEALATLGQRTALQAVSWALLRIFRRGEATGLVIDGVMELPFKQRDIADALGLSLVHTNKTLACLRTRQLANWSKNKLQIFDQARLAELALVDLESSKHRPLF
jgi:CRP-like cAMP-binding protein